MIKDVNENNFKSEISTGIVVVDFWAEWCAPCKQMMPKLEDANKQLAGEVKFLKVNIDKCPNVASDYNIRSLPTLLKFKDGALQDQKVGSVTTTVLMEWLNK